MNSMPFWQLKSFLKILIGVQYYLPSPSSLCSATSPMGRGTGCSHSMIQGQAQQIILLCLLTVLCPAHLLGGSFYFSIASTAADSASVFTVSIWPLS